MNCRKARKLIDRLLDGTLNDRASLDEHLEHCDACRSELARFQRLDDVVSRSLRCSPDDARLEQLTASILAGTREGETRAPAPVARLRWAFVPAVAVLAAFALGLGMGRAVWPRQTVVMRVVPKREVVEKLVQVRVPVIQERVVLKRVPVVRTRVVYRDRPVAPPPSAATSGQPATSPEAVKADEFVVSLNANLVTVRPVVSREVHPVTIILQPDADPDPAEPESDLEQGAREGRIADDVMFAQHRPRAQ